MDSLIVHAWEVFDSWIVLAWSLKNKELFRIGRREVFQIEPKYIYIFFYTMLFLAHVERVSVSRMRDCYYSVCLQHASAYQ